MPPRIFLKAFLRAALFIFLAGPARPALCVAADASSMGEQGAQKPQAGVNDANQKMNDYMRGRNPDALQTLVPVLVQLASTPEGQRALAGIFSGLKGQWAQSGERGTPSEFFAREMILRSPKSGVGYRFLAQERAAQGDLRGTIDAADKALLYGTPDAKLYLLRGGASDKLGDYESAHRDAAEALRLNPRDTVAISLYKLSEGQVAAPMPGGVQPGTESEARSAERQGMGADPRAQSAALTSEAAAALRLGDALYALQKAAAAVSLNAQNAQAYNLRATAEVKLSRYTAAVEDSSKALELAPGNPAALTTRAWAFGRLGSYGRALEDATGAVAGSPADGAAHYARAFALSGLGRRGEMLEELRTAAAAQPAFRGAYAAALQLPASSDPMLLFSGQEPAKAVVEPRAAAPRRHSALTIIVATLIGGFLIALGLLQNAGGLRGWTRRITRRSRPAEAQEEGSFWRRFAQVKEIGSGGMGIVYEAVDLGLKRRVAVKKMREEIRSSEREKTRFLEEARIVASLKHPNIVEIHSIEEEGQDVYLVFEFVEGRTLEQIFHERGVLRPAEARAIFQGVCAALAAAHERGVIHRDLKPANILVTPEGSPKVMDFGLARSMEAARLTTNLVWGSPAYMSPEQEEGEACPQSDIYSLGICLYEALTGRLPFAGSPAKAFLAKKEGKFVLPRQARPDLPPEADRILQQALDPKPDRRFASPKAFSEALERLGLG